VLLVLVAAALGAAPARAVLPTPTACQNDTDGANDQPGQKDVTRYCYEVGAGLYELIALANWDETTLTGNNTADVCFLFDNDSDGLANITVCVTLQSSGNANGNLAILKTFRLITCGDTRGDRCTGPVQVAGPYTTTCEVSQQSTDPFGPATLNGPGDQYPVDTQILCGIDLADFGAAGIGADLLDSCAYPSTIPNSDPSDCVAYAECNSAADCNDGNSCTTDTCSTGVCLHSPNTGQACSDGLYCNGDEICNNLGFCVAATPRNCDDEIDCTLDSCDEESDDCINDPRHSLCSNGAFCDGAEICNPLSGCQAGTPVDCDDEVSCTSDVCDEVHDTCVNTPSNAACNDGLYCNGVETCDANLGCQAGTPPNCSDAVVCTIDACNEGNDSCTHTPSNTVCDDSQFCNGVETCDANLGCQAGTPPNCNDGVPCTDDACNEGNDSCAHTPNNATCSDGQFCNGVETCDVVNGCQAGVAPDCGDGVGCTTDACNEATDSCTHTANNAACSDGQYCNGVETCHLVNGCQPGTPPNCSDGVVCTIDGCDEVGDVCTQTPSNAVCDDSQFCNGVETCNALTGCQAGTAPNCNDGVACTTDSCNEGADICSNVPNNGSCGDGQFCNGIEICDPENGCQPGTEPCPGQSLCNETTDQCVNCLNDSHCDNGVYCDGAETCNVGTGVCQPGTPTNCNDGVSCTQDSCNESTNSCDHLASDAACSDTLYCTGVETCDPVNDCQAGTPPNCNDGVSCTVDACSETLNACTHSPNSAACSDGQFCNGAETCDAKLGCQAGTPPNCSDGVGCTVDSCNEGSDTCTHAPNDAACSNGDFCDGSETCDAVTGCEAGVPPACADAVGCTVDACDEGTDSCTHTPNNAACSDGQFCNGTETCDATAGCRAGMLPNCNDGVACTTDSCNEVSDRCDHSPNNAACSDGQFCNGAETCDATAGCEPGTPPSCSDGIPCSTSFCNEVTDQCEFEYPGCFCGDGQVTGTEECDPPATAGTFEDCNNLVDDDGDGKIDCRDRDCAPDARDTLCDEGCTLDQLCEKFIKDPGLITYGWRTGTHDRLVLHGRFLLKKPSLLPMQNGFTFEMSNEDGVFYRIFLDETQFKVNRRGTGFLFLDKSSRDLGESSPSRGVYKVSLKQRNYSGVPYVSFRLVTYGDLGGATHVEMTTQLSAGGATGGLTAEWSARYGAWGLESRDF
jgi:hypothetical protein